MHTEPCHAPDNTNNTERCDFVALQAIGEAAVEYRYKAQTSGINAYAIASLEWGSWLTLVPATAASSVEEAVCCLGPEYVLPATLTVPPAIGQLPMSVLGSAAGSGAAGPSRAQTIANHAADHLVEASDQRPAGSCSVEAALTGHRPCALSPAVHELDISPPECDEHYSQKLQILAACGIGTIHYMHSAPTPTAVARLLASMLVCLADKRMLDTSCLQACLKAYAAACNEVEGSQSTSDGAAVGTLSLIPNGAVASSSARRALHWDILFAAQQQVIKLLPDVSRKASKAAVKQLLEALEDVQSDMSAAIGRCTADAAAAHVRGCFVYISQIQEVLNDWLLALKERKQLLTAARPNGAPSPATKHKSKKHKTSHPH